MVRPDAKVEKVYLYPKPMDFRRRVKTYLAHLATSVQTL